MSITMSTYEIKPANSDDDWTPAGETWDDAERFLRAMGSIRAKVTSRPAVLMFVRNNFNASVTVFEVNSLGYCDNLGSYHKFYGVAPTPNI